MFQLYFDVIEKIAPRLYERHLNKAGARAAAADRRTARRSPGRWSR